MYTIVELKQEARDFIYTLSGTRQKTRHFIYTLKSTDYEARHVNRTLYSATQEPLTSTTPYIHVVLCRRPVTLSTSYTTQNRKPVISSTLYIILSWTQFTLTTPFFGLNKEKMSINKHNKHCMENHSLSVEIQCIKCIKKNKSSVGVLNNILPFHVVRLTLLGRLYIQEIQLLSTCRHLIQDERQM